RVLDLEHAHQLPAVLSEGVEDLARVVFQERSDEVFPALHRGQPSRSTRLLAVRMHTPMMTSTPASVPMRAASSLMIPLWSHSTLAPISTACRAISGVADGRRNTSTTSTSTS